MRIFYENGKGGKSDSQPVLLNYPVKDNSALVDRVEKCSRRILHEDCRSDKSKLKLVLC